MSSFISRAAFSALLVVLISLSATVASGQEINATISGTAKDASGAVLPGAQVVLLNEDTGVTRTVQTDSAGRYLAPALPLGNYRLTGTKAGFQTEVRTGIALSVGQSAVVDFNMTVGAVTQTLEVTGEAPSVETTNAVVSSLVTGEQVRELPLNGRSLTDLTLLNPGVMIDHNSGNSPACGLGPRLSINGGRNGSTLYLLDGTVTTNRNGGSSSTTGALTGVESIREFRLLSHNFGAEYGQNSGGVISMVSRSGTNQFHGSLYEFFRNSDMDARDFFDRQQGKAPLKQNQFGGAFGGPIKKDRLWFFGNYEGLRRAQSVSYTENVPDANARLGNIPTSAAVCASSNGTYTNASGLCHITINPTVQQWLQEFPLANDVNFGDGTARSIVQVPYPYTENYYIERTDFRLSDKDTVYGRWSWDPSSRNRPLNPPNFYRPDLATNMFATVGETHIFSAGMLNEFRFAFNRTWDGSTNLSQLSLPSSTDENPGAGTGSITFTTASNSQGGNAFLSTEGNATSIPSKTWRNLFETNDAFSLILGAHALKFGGDFQRLQQNTKPLSNLQGGEYTFDTLAHFLLGQPTNLAGSVFPPGYTAERGNRWDIIAWFIQDDWRIRSNLTLNLGLRHEFVTDTYEVNGFSGAIPWYPNSVLPLPAGVMPVPGAGSNYAKLNFAPRFGLAWDPKGDGKTAVRVGAGLYDNLEQGASGAASFAQTTSFSLNFDPTVPDPGFPHQFPTSLAQSTAALALTVMPWPLATPKSIHYGVDIQRQLTRTFSALLGYVGSYSYNQTRDVQLNIRQYTVEPNGTYFWAAGAPRIDPKYGAISATFADGVANYNALQATLRKALSGGLIFTGSYTYSKALSDSDKTGALDITNNGSQISLDKNNANYDYGLSGYDQRHALTFNASYDFQLERHLTAGFAKTMLGGWGIKGLWQWSSGLPLNINVSYNNSRSLQTGAAERPNLLPGFSNNPTSGASAGCGPIPAQPLQTANLWFDPCAFAVAPAGTWGNLGRDTVEGPPSDITNFTLAKVTNIKESMKLEFRTEVFNLFNHPNFNLPIISLFNGDGTHNGSEGSISGTWSKSRQIQLGLKLIF